MRQIAEFVAVLACGLFAGAAIYVNLVEHPARMECGVELAATEFPPSYRRGTIMTGDVGSRVPAVFYCSMACWGDILVARCRSLAGFGHPFTPIVILPTNKQLLSPTLDRRSAQTERLLARWGTLHAVRSVLSGLALLLFLYLLIFTRTA
jgi:hypothetical protein